MALRSRMAAVGVSATVLEGAAGVWAIASLGPARFALYLLASATATALMTLAMWRLLVMPPRDEEPGFGGGPPDGSDPPPPWWPDFEQEFWLYALERAEL